MIRQQRVARIHQGRNQEAFQLAREISDYVNSTYPGITVGAYREIYGQIGTLHWFIEAADLAALDAYRQQLPSDDRYQMLAHRIATEGLFVEGSFHDTLLESL